MSDKAILATARRSLSDQSLEWEAQCRADWPTWRCGICSKQPCDGHGHYPVPEGEL